MKASGSFKGISLFMGAGKLAMQVSQALGASAINLVHMKPRGHVYDRKDIKNNTLLGEARAHAVLNS